MELRFKHVIFYDLFLLVQDGTELQSFFMVPGSMTKELIYGMLKDHKHFFGYPTVVHCGLVWVQTTPYLA